MTIEQLIATYGLPALYVGSALEGEAVAVIGGMLAHRGLFPLSAVAPVLAAGSFTSDQLLFALGRRYRDHPRVMRLRETAAYSRAELLLERWQTLYILAFRFLWGLRTVSPLAIGISSVSARRYILLNLCAAVVWGCLFATLGWVLGGAVERVFGRIHRLEHWLAILVVPLLLLAAFRILITRKLR